MEDFVTFEIAKKLKEKGFRKEALMIWGVGSTIDYVKSNETAKQLPDKCIEALDKWVDNLNKEENNK